MPGPDPCNPANIFAEDPFYPGEANPQGDLLRELLVRLYERSGTAGLEWYASCLFRGPEPVDPTEIEDILMLGSDSKQLVRLLDLNQFSAESLAYKEELLQTALTDGQVELWRGSTVSRHDAYGMVSIGGIIELHTAVLQQCLADPPDWISCNALAYLQSLVPSPGSYSERVNVLGNQLLAFEPHHLAEIYDNDPDFKRALEFAIDTFCPQRDSCGSLRFVLCQAADTVYGPHPLRRIRPVPNRGTLDQLIDDRLAEPCATAACPETLFTQLQPNQDQ